MAKKNTQPELRFAGFTEDWEECSLIQISNPLTGYPFSSKQFRKEGIYLVRGMNVKRGYLDLSKSIAEFWKTSQGLEMYLLQEGDVVIQMDGALIGKSYAKIKSKHLPALLVQRVTRLRSDLNTQEFIYQYIQRDFLKYINSIKTETAVPHLSLDDIKNFRLSVPKSPEERLEIGVFLSKLDKLITKHQQKHENLKVLKKAMLDKMFPREGQTVPEIRFKGFSGDWDESKLGSIGDPYTGLSGKTKSDFGHGEGRYITYMNVFSNPISNLDSTDKIEIDSSQNQVKAGDVLFTVSSETAEDVGMSSVWTGNQDDIYLNSFCFGYRPNIKIDCHFLANILRAPKFREKMKFLAQGISRYNISKNKVMEIFIDLPEYKEQELIGNYFKNLDNLIANHNTQIEKLNNLKKALLAKMFI